MPYFKSKKAVVQFADDTLTSLKSGSRLIMTIVPEPSGGCYATTVIEDLLDATVKKRARRSYKRRTIISPENTSDG